MCVYAQQPIYWQQLSKPQVEWNDEPVYNDFNF